MKKKRFLTLGLAALLGVISLTGQGYKSVGQIKEPAGQIQESRQIAKNLGFQIKRAFGETGKQVLTVSVTPSNADINLSYSVDKEQVIVEKTGAKTANVHVTTFFAGHATITVTDTVSGITGTGRVFSYGKSVLEPKNNLAHAQNGVVVISNNANPATTTGVTKVAQTQTFMENSLTSIYGEWGAPDSGYVAPSSTVYLHIGYNGSYAPVVFNATNNQLYQKTDDVAADPGSKSAVITVTVDSGVNELYLLPRTGPTLPSKPTDVVNATLLGGFFVQNATASQSIVVPDITFND